MKAPQIVKKAQAGFTLIELMIVVAIIGILAAVAIPAYQNYTVKAKVGAALSSLSSLQTAVANCIQEAGGDKTQCSTDAAGTVTSGIPVFNATKELDSASVTNGKITAKFATSGIAADVNGLSFTMDSNVGTSTLTWTVDASAITNKTAAAALTKNSIGS